MRRSPILLTIALTTYTVAAHAQGTMKLPDVAGAWATKSMIGPRDSVVTRSQLFATADGQGWTMKFAGRPAIPVRVVSAGGDSVVSEAGPFPSILRPGQTVSSLRLVAHFKGDAMWGTFEAHYSTGDVLRGKTAGTRSK